MTNRFKLIAGSDLGLPITIFVLLALPLVMPAQSKPLEFKDGQSTAEVRGTLKGNQIIRYSFSARRDQQIKVSVTSKRSNWLVVRVYPAAAPTGADIVSNYISGEETLSGQIPEDGGYIAFLGIRRPEARRGGTVNYQLHVELVGDTAAGNKSSSAPPAEWVQKGACPFECCRYGKWIARSTMTLYARQDRKSAVVAVVPSGATLEATTGETHTKAGMFRFSRAEGSFKPGDELSVYDYVGEGNFRVWAGGRMTEMDLSVGPTGRTEGRSGVMERRPQQEWWANVTTSGGYSGWVLVEKPVPDGSDACGQ